MTYVPSCPEHIDIDDLRFLLASGRYAWRCTSCGNYGVWCEGWAVRGPIRCKRCKREENFVDEVKCDVCFGLFNAKRAGGKA